MFARFWPKMFFLAQAEKISRNFAGICPILPERAEVTRKIQKSHAHAAGPSRKGAVCSTSSIPLVVLRDLASSCALPLSAILQPRGPTPRS